jgi:23S rRNA (pseudouridine1915-N3)-methyltransferase
MLKITIITLGNKMPGWVEDASQAFMKRLQDHVQLNLIEMPLIKRGKSSDVTRILEKEMLNMRAAIPNQSYLIALDKSGRMFSSEQLATQLEQLQQKTSHLCFLIGGPEGISAELLRACHERWSLSTLTFPHTIARIILLEALYRSWSILQNHPYHK